MTTYYGATANNHKSGDIAEIAFFPITGQVFNPCLKAKVVRSINLKEFRQFYLNSEYKEKFLKTEKKLGLVPAHYNLYEYEILD